jgi:tRNA (cmo5U34)-methyltransferase
VHFTPGARTAWHSHTNGQTLHVTDGEGLVQSRGEPVVTIHSGDTVHTPGDEWHWHGATPDHAMTHLSITEGDATWGEHVTDDEYFGTTTATAGGDQFHFDPATYLDMVRAEVPAYDELQRAVADATADVRAERVLELGVGNGETSLRVLEVHPGAVLVGLDESPEMLSAAAGRLAAAADLRVGRFEDPLPEGSFDLVVSALAVHHVDDVAKAALYVRIAERLRPGGRFVLGDVVIPADPADVVTPIDGEFDKPSTVDDQLRWLAAAGFDARVVWLRQDLAVIVADVH